MKRLSVHPDSPEPGAMAVAAGVLRAGGLVAFPTETVYGLGARALVAADVKRIFAAKGRPDWNPLIAHVTDGAMARRDLVARWDARTQSLVDAFWPGPLTLVLPRRPTVPDEVTAGLPSVAVRSPAHPVARALIAALDAPVAAPSANRFQHISPTTADHVVRSLGDAVDLVVDGGACQVGVESTVLDLCGDTPRLLRSGGVTLAELRAFLGTVEDATGPVADGKARLAPGMAQRHYAPDAQVHLVAYGDAPAAARLLPTLPRPLGALTFSLSIPADHAVHLGPDAAAAQRGLYAALHTLESAGCQTILLEAPPPAPAWDAVRDRLQRAAATNPTSRSP